MVPIEITGNLVPFTSTSFGRVIFPFNSVLYSDFKETIAPL